jgi:regulation of enolase protein 1 (concanavalin A-like superfamily)
MNPGGAAKACTICKPNRRNMKSIDFSAAKWLHQPGAFEISSESVKITTEPHSDFWQRSYYGFRNDNAHALQVESGSNFSFTARASFDYRDKYDQCGLIIYLDSNNWFKASIEYENKDISRLGSVVTNNGYSDWATTDLPTPGTMWYRLSRRGPDFLIESSSHGADFRQMRIFHLHILGETTAEMGRLDPPAPARQPVPFGLYACSPLESSFEARFDHLKLEDCLWKAHGG